MSRRPSRPAAAPPAPPQDDGVEISFDVDLIAERLKRPEVARQLARIILAHERRQQDRGAVVPVRDRGDTATAPHDGP